jgi:autotransporter-associated beta strand protein
MNLPQLLRRTALLCLIAPASSPGLLPPPTGVQPAPATNSGVVVLTWSNVAGATGYVVKRGASPTDALTSLATVTNTTFTDTNATPGTAYYYAVATLDADGESPNPRGTRAATVTVLDTDDPGVTFTGAWTNSSTPGSFGAASVYAATTAGSTATATYTFAPDLAARGLYDVYLHWTAAANRPTNGPVDLRVPDSTNTYRVNQTTNGSTWMYVGTMSCDAGTNHAVVIRDNSGVAGTYIVADAVQFIPRLRPWSPAAEVSADYALMILDEQFDGTNVNQSVWSTFDSRSDYGVSNGYLHTVLRYTGAVALASATTNELWNEGNWRQGGIIADSGQKYGYHEARIRLPQPPAKGVDTAYWHGAVDELLNGYEIDAPEFFNSSTSANSNDYGFGVWDHVLPTPARPGLATGRTWDYSSGSWTPLGDSTQFITIGLEWRVDNSQVVYINGVKVYTAPVSGMNDTESILPSSIILSTKVLDWMKPNTNLHLASATWDYARYYQKPGWMGGLDGQWTNALNWGPDGRPSNGIAAVFNYPAASNTTITLATTQSVQTIFMDGSNLPVYTFNGPGVLQLGGGTGSVTHGGILINTAVSTNQVFNVDLFGWQNLQFANLSRTTGVTLYLNGTITAAGSRDVDFVSPMNAVNNTDFGRIVLNGPLGAGFRHVNRAGDYNFTLPAGSQHTGEVRIARGPVTIPSVSSLGTTSNSAVVFRPRYKHSSSWRPRLTYTGPGETSFHRIVLGGWQCDGVLESSGSGPLDWRGSVSIAPSDGNPKQVLSDDAVLTLGGTNTADNTFAGRIADTGVMVTNNPTGTNVTITPAALSLIKSGTGTWVLTGSNSVTAPVSVTGGRLYLGAGTNGSLNTPSVSISIGASFGFGWDDDRTSALLLTGSGSVRKRGSGWLTLTGSNTYSGGTILEDGTLSGNLGSGALTVSGGTYAPGTNVSHSGFTLSSGGALHIDLGGTNLGSGYDSVAAGSVSLAGTLDLVVSDTNLPLNSTYLILNNTGASPVSGTFAGLPQNALMFASNHAFRISYTGGTGNDVVLTLIANSSVIWTGDDVTNVWNTAASGQWRAGAVPVVFSNGTFAVFDDTGSTLPPVSLTTTLSPSGVLVNSTNHYTFTGTGTLTGALSLAKEGTGSLTLNATNTFTGSVSVAEGTLIGRASSFPVSIGTVPGSEVVFDEPGSATWTNVISGGGSVRKRGAGTLLFSGANSFSGGITVEAGTLRGNNTGSGDLAVTGGTFDLNGGDRSFSQVTLAGGLITNSSGGNGNYIGGPFIAQAGTLAARMGTSSGIIKETTGTVVLTGGNTFLGGTTISNGTLCLNSPGTLASSVTVTGGTFSGNGTVNASVTVLSGTVNPGVTNGTLTITNAFTLGSDGTLRIEITGTNSSTQIDRVTVGGPITLAGTLELSVTSTNLPVASTFLIVNDSNGGAISGTFAGLPENSILTAGGYSFRISYVGNTGNDVVLTRIATVPLATTQPATGVTSTGATLNGDVVPGDQAASAFFQYGATTNYGSLTPTLLVAAGTNVVAVATNLAGLDPGATYHYRLVATNTLGSSFGSDAVFSTPALPPVVTTLAVSAVSASNATFQASVNPGGAPTDVFFDYGTTTNYGLTTPPATLPAGNLPVALSNTVVSLIPGTTYHVRAAGSNSAGIALGSNVSFTTPILPPAVTTLPATALGLSNATLNASVNPGGGLTLAFFEFGTSTNLGLATATTNLPAGPTNLAVAIPLASLSNGWTYYYRAVASNAAGTVTGDLLSFTLVDSGVTNVFYWDTDGAIAGTGPSPTGDWNASNAFWNSSAAGLAGLFTNTTTLADVVNFAAGSTATNAYTVSLSGTQSVAQVFIKDGTLTLDGGTIAFAASSSSSDNRAIVRTTSNTRGTVHVNSGLRVMNTNSATGLLKLIAGNGTAATDLSVNGPISVATPTNTYQVRLGGAGNGRITANLGAGGLLLSSVQADSIQRLDGRWTLAGTQTLGNASITLPRTDTAPAGVTGAIVMGDSTNDVQSWGATIANNTNASLILNATATLAGNISFESGSNLTVNGSVAFTGVNQVITFASTNALYTNRFTLASGARLSLRIGATNAFNRFTKLTNAFANAVAVLDGQLAFNTTAATTLPGSTWQIFPTTNTVLKTFGPTFSVSGFTPNASTNLWSRTEGTNLWTFSTVSGQLSVTNVTTSPYDSWAATNGLDNSPGHESAFDADPDADGLVNGLEWVLGGSPLASDAAGIQPSLAVTTTNATFSFLRNDDSESTTTLLAQWSGNLLEWSSIPIGASSSGPVSISENGAAPDTISVSVPTTNAVNGSLFLRLNVTTP